MQDLRREGAVRQTRRWGFRYEGALAWVLGGLGWHLSMLPQQRKRSKILIPHSSVGGIFLVVDLAVLTAACSALVRRLFGFGVYASIGASANGEHTGR
jgi:hypothetical protein